MRLSLTLWVFLLAGAAAAQPVKADKQLKATAQSLTLEGAYNKLSNDVAALLRRAMAEPNDATALALLEGEGAHLLMRRQQLQPTLRKWLATLTPAQRQKFDHRIQTSNGLMQYILWMVEKDSKTNVRLNNNPKLTEAFAKLVDVIGMGG
ncbi:MAG TPA: hypothetical protein VF690_21485 [Hymenobacter sp.]|jgi:hypothetical protein